MTIKREDAIKMLESPKKLLHQQIIFHDKYNTIQLAHWDKIQSLATYKLPSVHEKCRKSSRIPVKFERQTPQYQISCRIPTPQSFAFPKL